MRRPPSAAVELVLWTLLAVGLTLGALRDAPQATRDAGTVGAVLAAVALFATRAGAMARGVS